MRKLFIKLISIVYRFLLKPILFSFDPEAVHDHFIKVGKLIAKVSFLRFILRWLFVRDYKELKQNLFGLDFINPVGLAAGFDKNADLISVMKDVGFGFEEVGSITALPCEGNPKPRLYRLKKSMGIVVYYGLKNLGAEKIIQKIKNSIGIVEPLFISVARTNCKENCDHENSINDYLSSIKMIKKNNVGDAIVINISCPNAYQGEEFLNLQRLDKLLVEVKKLNFNKPILLKMPINKKWEEFEEFVKSAILHGISGLIIGNLNKDHQDKNIVDQIPLEIKGGVSGKPTFDLSNDLIAKTYKKYGDEIKIIGVGGIFSAEDAYLKIKLGSSLVQLITGMIFVGPQLIAQINDGLVELLKKDGFKNINEAIGKNNRL